jgi:hypothetical protein
MRELIAVAALAALITSAAAQQARPPGQSPKPPAQSQPRAPAPPPLAIFPCRTAEEVCFLAVVTGKSQVAVLFTNADKAEGIDAKPVEVSTGDSPGAGGTPLDLTQHVGRIVMLTGAYDAQAGVTKAELVEVASPLVSLVVKAQIGGDEEPPPPAGKPPPQQKPRR